jgi:hypothetical protein
VAGGTLLIQKLRPNRATQRKKIRDHPEASCYTIRTFALTVYKILRIAQLGSDLAISRPIGRWCMPLTKVRYMGN